MVIEILLIIALIAGCAISSYSDLRFGKIDNRLIFGLLIFALIGNSLLYGFFETDLLISFIWNYLTIILLGFLLYFTHIWAGGDCKLLLALSALVPVGLYWNYGSLEITLWISLAITFCIGFLFLIIETIVLMVREKTKFDFCNMKSQLISGIKKYVKLILYLSAIHHIYYFFIYPVFALPNIIYICLCILAALKIVQIEIANSKLLIVAVLLFDVGMTVFTGSLMVSMELKIYLLVLSFMVLKIILMKYNYQSITIQDLKPGMILSKSSSLWMQQSRVKGLPGISDETLKSRLNQDEVDSIRRWENSKYGMNMIVIVRKIPFAIFISLGFIIYLILGVCK